MNRCQRAAWQILFLFCGNWALRSTGNKIPACPECDRDVRAVLGGVISSKGRFPWNFEEDFCSAAVLGCPWSCHRDDFAGFQPELAAELILGGDCGEKGQLGC